MNIYQCGADCTADQETGGADYYNVTVDLICRKFYCHVLAV